MKSASFAPKIAWELGERRRLRLHATLAGIPETDLDRCVSVVQALLDQIGPISVCLKGPFQGTRNTGRIYFPVYPQNIRGEDPFALVQKSIGVTPTKLYLVGYYHMRQDPIRWKPANWSNYSIGGAIGLSSRQPSRFRNCMPPTMILRFQRACMRRCRSEVARVSADKKTKN
jgi:hypothetical protein